MSYVLGGQIAAADFNGFLATVNNVYGTGNASYGYGQTGILQGAVSSGAIIHALEWANLWQMVHTCATHQGTTTSTLPPVSAYASGAIIHCYEQTPPTSSQYEFGNVTQSITSNRLLTSPANMTLTSGALTITRTTQWDTNISAVFDCNFGSEDAARFFFNSGGQIRIRVSQPSGSPRDASWQNLLSSEIGTMTLASITNTSTNPPVEGFSISGTATSSVNNVGFYALGSSSPTTLVNGQNLGIGVNSGQSFTLTAYVLSHAGVNGGNGSGIRFTVTLHDPYLDNTVPALQAGTVLNVDVLRATYLQGIAMPSLTTVTGFNSSNQPPIWNTTGGAIVAGFSNGPISYQLSATDPQGIGLTYSVVSGSLPAGVGLSSGGLVSGTLPIIGTQTTYSFSVMVSDGSNSSTRGFSIVALPAVLMQEPGNGSWTVPAGVNNVMFTWVIAGGGAGGAGDELAYGGGGGGGGSGGYVHYQAVACSPGDTFTWSIGAGGQPSDPTNTNNTSPGVNGVAAGATVVYHNGGPVIYTGGAGNGFDAGISNSYVSGTPYGGGGGGPNGTAGGNGESGTGDTASSTGGNGAWGPLTGALGGAGGTPSNGATGAAGVGYGSGGGGAGSIDRDGTQFWYGGAGQPGYVEFIYPSQGSTGGTSAGSGGVTSGGSSGSGGTGGTGGGGGGDGACCWDEALLASGKRIGDTKLGDEVLLLHRDGTGHYPYRITAIRGDLQECGTMVTKSGITLTCSYTTPIAFRRPGSLEVEFQRMGLHLVGTYVPVLDQGVFRWELLVDVQDRGPLPVQLLTCDNGVYAAGDQPDRQIFTHNLDDKP